MSQLTETDRPASVTSEALAMLQFKSRHVLVVEDDRDIAELVALHLRDDGYKVQIACDGAQALDYIARDNYDLAVLDVMLPHVDGLEVCRRLRAGSAYTLILMLTSKITELDRVLGLELGADDYLTKPFSVRELLARVKALFRRADALGAPGSAAPADCPSSHAEVGGAVIQLGDLRIDVEKRRVSLGAGEINLTAKEFDLLYQFACHPGRVYTRAQLLDAVWGFSYEGYEHTVNSHINRLRAKLEEDPANPHYLLTVWGVGYKFVDAPGADGSSPSKGLRAA